MGLLDTLAKEQSDTFRVRTVGLRAAAHDHVSLVTSRLAAQFKIDAQRARSIVQGRIVARDVSERKARALKTRLLQLGVVAKVERSDAVLPPSSAAVNNIDAFFDGLARPCSHRARDRRYYTFVASRVVGSLLCLGLYAAICLGLCAGVWAYTVSAPLQSSAGGLVVWATPIGAALLAGTALLRPLFAREGKLARIEIEAAHAPQLFRLVAQISQLTNTVKPERVFVNCEVDARLSHCAGVWGLPGRRLELTIGMPLVHGMSTLQLASLLTQEFGHFGHTFELLSRALINRISAWMGRNGWSKDPLQSRLETYCEETDSFFRALPALTAIQAIRSVSWLFRKLYQLNLHVSRPLSQQLEIDADRYAVQVVGSAAFMTTAQRLRELLRAESLAGQCNRDAYEDNRLFNNLPGAISDLSTHLSDDVKAALSAELDTPTARYWTAHPADRERIEHAAAAKIANVRHGASSATLLFDDADKLARQVTMLAYASDRDFPEASDSIVENQIIRDIQRHRGEGQAAIAEYFGDGYAGHIFKFSRTTSGQEHLPGAPGVLVKVRDDKRSRLDDLLLSSVYSQCGMTLEPGTWNIVDHAPEAVEAQMQAIMKDLRQAENKLQTVDQYFQTQIGNVVDATSAGGRTRALYNWCIEVATLCDDLENLTRYTTILSALLHTLSENDITTLEPTMHDYRKHCVEAVNRLLGRFRKLANPMHDSASGSAGESAPGANVL